MTPRILYSIPFLGVVLFVFSVAFPPFDDLTTVNLSVHMLEHIMIIFAGALIGYPLYRRGWFSSFPRVPTSLVAVVAVAIILTYWHFPGPWDSAVLNPAVHAVEHFSFLLSGFLIGAFFPMLTDSRKVDVLALGFAAHIFYGIALIFEYQIYPLYSIYQQLWLGVWVFMPTPIYLYFIVVYILASNTNLSRDIGEQFGFDVQRFRTRAVGLGASSRRYVPVLSLCLLVALGGYYSVAGAAALTSSAPSSQHGAPVIYILETPVTWNYSPQHMVVVIGVNNTVTWVSKSFAVDTISSSTGEFNSGNILPGGTYVHTFDQAGNYTYNCLYHPWMIGEITVLPAA
jgi:plastocyanin